MLQGIKPGMNHVKHKNDAVITIAHLLDRGGLIGFNRVYTQAPVCLPHHRSISPSLSCGQLTRFSPSIDLPPSGTRARDRRVVRVPLDHCPLTPTVETFNQASGVRHRHVQPPEVDHALHGARVQRGGAGGGRGGVGEEGADGGGRGPGGGGGAEEEL